MKTVTTATAAAAIGVSRKRLDNVLAREGRALLPTGRHGRARRIPVRAIETVALALVLNRDLCTSISKGLELSAALLASPTVGSVELGSLGRLTFDVEAFRRLIEEAVAESIEETATPQRGRPRTPRVPREV